MNSYTLLLSLEDVFGLSISTNDQTLNDVCRMLVQRLYDRYIKLQNTEEERRSKLALATVEDNAFNKFAWLLKAFDDKKKLPNSIFLTNAHVATENAYGMLKDR